MRLFKFFLKVCALVTLISVKKVGVPNFMEPIDSTPWFGSVLSFLIFAISINLLITFLIWVYRKRKQMHLKMVDNVINGLKNIYYLILFIGLLFLILALFGIRVEQVVTTLTIVAAAIALIFKEFILDIVCGIVMSFTTDLAIRDHVKIGDHRGKVIDINLVKLTLHNEDDDIIIIPNSKAYFSEIINYTKLQIRKSNVDFVIDAAKKISSQAIEKKLDEILKSYVGNLEAENGVLKIIKIEDKAIHYKYQFSLTEVNQDLKKEIKAKLFQAIVDLVHA